MQSAEATESPTATDAPRGDLWSLLHRYRVALLVGAALVAGLVVAVQARPITLYDDAAITMRYAHRIASGDGWTYNDGDRTNGASAPLYTLVLAALKAAGFGLVPAARVVTTACFTVCIGMTAFIGSRIAGVWNGALASTFLLLWIDFQTQSLSGMESALAVALGLAVIICVDLERDTLAGVFLGLALVNKLDAGLLALAVAVAVVAIRRRPPWRIAGVSAAVAAPWFAFAWLYFGSPLPYSFTQKVSDDLTNNPIDLPRTWVWDALMAQEVGVFVLLAAASAFALPWLATRRRGPATALAICLAWPLLVGLAYTAIDLGDAYPWYLTALYAPLSIAAASAVVLVARSARGHARPLTIATMVAVSAASIGVARTDFGAVGAVSRTVREGHDPQAAEAFEKARRDAAMHLASIAEPDDVIASCFGWFAFEAIDNPIDELCPLNTREPVGEARWLGTATFPGTEPQDLPEGAEIVATFTSGVGPGGRADVILLPEPDTTEE